MIFIIVKVEKKEDFMKKIFFATLILSLIPLEVEASERHFGYSYETDILQNEQIELETYSLYKFGRDTYFSGLDQRFEFELGLGGGVQTSIYLNFEQEMADDGTGTIHNDFLSDGLSNEWKFKLSDNLTDGLGLGLYIESGFKPDEFELETKFIFDKRMGNWLWTLNLSNEPELHFDDNTLGFSIIPSFGLGYFLVNETLFLGLEAQIKYFWYNTSLPITAALFMAGPVLAYQSKDWWVTLAFSPQLINFLGPNLDFVNGERDQIQLGFSIALNAQQKTNEESLPVPIKLDAEQLSKTVPKIRLQDLSKGRDLYANRCQRCHKLHFPSEFTSGNWERIMAKMRSKTTLDANSIDRVLWYLKAFAKKD